MKYKKIEFIKTNQFKSSDEYSPIPSSKILPDWYKKTDSYVQGRKAPYTGQTPATIKKCIPVFDSISAGYMILTHCDIFIKIIDGVPEFINPRYTTAIDSHNSDQAKKYPLINENTLFIPKYVSPWGIKTESGYSCLFLPPAHRDNIISILPGIVDTDNYNDLITFPFLLTKMEDGEILIPAGTPVVQVIPFKRDSWKMSISKNIDLLKNTRDKLFSLFFDAYKTKFWNKKEYL